MARPTPVINPAFIRRRDVRTTGGFTLAECLIASVVLAIAVLGICGALTAATRQTEAMEVEAHCLSMARQLMEQIAACAFDPPASNDHPGWGAANADSWQYDDIKDFNGYDEDTSIVLNPVQFIDTVTFHRQASVQFRATPGGAANPAGDFAMISVTVTPDSHAEPLTLHRMAARYKIVRE
jgi:prepilin-type N-terminal cleavage/methylation domain-containing protein